MSSTSRYPVSSCQGWAILLAVHGACPCCFPYCSVNPPDVAAQCHLPNLRSTRFSGLCIQVTFAALLKLARSVEHHMRAERFVLNALPVRLSWVHFMSCFHGLMAKLVQVERNLCCWQLWYVKDCWWHVCRLLQTHIVLHETSFFVQCRH